MGLRVVNDEIFYTAQDGIYKVSKISSAPEKWETSLLAKFMFPTKDVGGDLPIAFNTAYYKGDFYYTIGAYKNFNPSPTNQGWAIKMNMETGAQEVIGRGIRNPNGMDVNTSGDVFIADNQGEFRPGSAFLANMFLLDATPFAGQLLVGDNAFGGVHRVSWKR